MSRVFAAPRELLQRKPPHGAACTRCGLCCIATQCELSLHLFGERPGPCPALVFDEHKQSSCGLAGPPATPQLAAAAAHLIRAGLGCDARFNGEPVNHQFNAELDARDKQTRGATYAARQQWGML